MRWLWTWEGQCFGYRDGDDLWSADGRHVGKFYGNEVYDSDGMYLGEIKGGSRLITDLSKKKLNKEQFEPQKPRRRSIPFSPNEVYLMHAGYEEFPRL